LDKEELRSAMEIELGWRQEELAFFKNQLGNIVKDIDKDKYRKSLVLLLYSHFEGFMKICLQTYIQYINSLNKERSAFKEELIVSSMNREFNAFDNNDEKCQIFKKKLPEDKKLHRFYRRVNLMESIDEFKQNILVIQDDTIDTESNLWYIVLQKNLYKVGLSVDLFDEYAKDIDALVNRRNSIAHGNEKSGISEDEYTRWESKIYKVMEGIIKVIHRSTSEEQYLKSR
jgi:hypothetical protein